MKRPIASAAAGAVFLFALPLANEAAGQPADAAHRKYLFQATFTVEGIRRGLETFLFHHCVGFAATDVACLLIGEQRAPSTNVPQRGAII